MIDDAELLRRYVKGRSEEAFTELVRRHAGLVYACALRRVGFDAHLAEDVTQGVFGDLGRKAPGLLARSSVPGWLYVSTQLASAEAVRKERRRKAREGKACALDGNSADASANPESDWGRLRPMLDDVILALPGKDREVVVLRFFSNRAYAQIGPALGVTEEAARKRVDRALEKMRVALERRGVTSTVEALSIALAEGAGEPVPPRLADRVAGVALGEFTAAGASTSFLLNWFGTLAPNLAAVTAAIVVAGLLWALQHAKNAALSSEIGRIEGQRAVILELERGNRQAARALAEAEGLRRSLAPSPAPQPALTRAAPGAPAEIPIHVDVTAQGTVLWEGERVTLAEFLSRVVAARAQQPGAGVAFVVHGEAGAAFSATSYVMEQASKAGFLNIVIDSPARPSPADSWVSSPSTLSTDDRRPPTLPDLLKGP